MIWHEGGKMDCKTVKERLADYLLGELDLKEEIAISEHLIDCESCAREAQVLQQFFETMHDTHTFKPSRNVYERIRANTGMTRTMPPLLSFLRKPIRCYHAIAALLLGIMLTLLSTTLLEHRNRLVETVNAPRDTIHELSASEDSITFYTAPPHRLVSR